MNDGTNWTETWLEAYRTERGCQWMYDGTAREVAEAKGWKIIDSHAGDDMVLAQKEKGTLIAIGILPRSRGFGFWSVDIKCA